MTRDLGRFHQLIFAVIAISSLSGCAQSQPKPADIMPFPDDGHSAAPASTAAGYTLNTPIERIASDPQGAAILNKDIPGLLTNSNYEMFKGMSLRTLSHLSHGELDEQTLAQTENDLAALSKRSSLDR